MNVQKNILVVALFLVPPYIALLVGLYWRFLDNAAPVELVYQHPKFLYGPADNRDEAKLKETDFVMSGGTVWIYRELCTFRSLYGTVRGDWVAGAFVWQTPERSLVPRKLGCVNESFTLTAPTSNPTRDFTYQVEWLYEVNPLVTVAVAMPALHLRVYAPNDCATLADKACKEPGK